MNNLAILIRVELTEAAKEYKYVWLTIFFIILGLTQPLINMYLEIILQQLGGTFGVMLDPNKPSPTSNEIFLSTISGQFNQIGLVILIISFMSLIAADRENGMQDFILTRPVSIYSYVYAKLIAHWLISMFSILFGILISYFYTVYLFGSFSLLKLISFSFLYSLWILYLVSLVIVISIYIKHQVLIAVSTIGITFVLLFINNFNPTFSYLLPSSILNVAAHQISDAHDFHHLSVVSCLLFTISHLVWATMKLKRI
ncbi:ABC transporter permease [Exiguobacterium antarcticum]|uniref:ABC transporter permease n=1 Tax=Exiguobacterium antarcticum TaxID=132920 RepID=UPI00047C62D1|nr:ABC transporter permease subunit [Exiguobacterium antarcticum]